MRSVAGFSAALLLAFAFALALRYMAGSFIFTTGAQVIIRANTIEDYQRIAVVMGLIEIVVGGHSNASLSNRPECLVID